VIGHPARRRRPHFSIRDNFLLDLDDRLVHYRSPTEPGSSGSPVFNEEWEVFALHYRGLPQMPRLHGAGTYEANEGVRIDAILSQAVASR
jgi:V8-like Glu-specific endopeptidase